MAAGAWPTPHDGDCRIVAGPGAWPSLPLRCFENPRGSRSQLCRGRRDGRGFLNPAAGDGLPGDACCFSVTSGATPCGSVTPERTPAYAASWCWATRGCRWRCVEAVASELLRAWPIAICRSGLAVVRGRGWMDRGDGPSGRGVDRLPLNREIALLIGAHLDGRFVERLAAVA